MAPLSSLLEVSKSYNQGDARASFPSGRSGDGSPFRPFRLLAVVQLGDHRIGVPISFLVSGKSQALLLPDFLH